MTALITGASSGIGLELARVFAGHRHDLVLVARTASKLEALADECRRAGVKAHVLPADLSDVDGRADVVRRVGELGLAIDILVNNAGYGAYGPFLETSLESELAMIQLNVAATTELTKRFLPSMVQRRAGRIMNVASTAAFFPGPLMAVYYATKAYVLSFSEAIAKELEGTGVTVTALCPGPTESGFAAAANQQESKLIAGRKLPTSADVARAGYDALMRGDVVYIPGIANKAMSIVPRLFPRGMVRTVVRAVQERRTT